MTGPSPHAVYASLRVYHRSGVVGMSIFQTRQPFSSHRQSSTDASYLTVNALGNLLWTGELPYHACLLLYPIQTRLHWIVC